MPEKPTLSRTTSRTTPETKLEIPENATPEQIVVQLETEAEALAVSPDIQEDKGSLTDDMRAFARRMEERTKILIDLLDKEPGNPGLDMAKQITDYSQIERYFTGLPNAFVEYANLIDNGQTEFWLDFNGQMPRIGGIFKAAKRLEAYIQPLLNQSDKGALPIRALIAVLNGTITDLTRTFRPYGVAIDDVQILSPAPKDAEVEHGHCEGFFLMGRGGTLPMRQMRELVIAKQKETEAPIVTDIWELGWSYKGERKKRTVVITYRENTWDTAERSSMRGSSPNFRTS